MLQFDIRFFKGFFLLAFFMIPCLWAQQEDLRFERLTVEDGLSHNSVYCILQDRLGFMWFGTGDGFNKFDGYEFQVYKYDLEKPNTRTGRYVFSMLEDRYGKIWIGTGGGLSSFDPETEQFTHYQHDPDDSDSLADDQVWSLFEDRDGQLWVGSFGGLSLFDRKNNRFIHYKHSPYDDSTLSQDYVFAIQQDSKGRLWVGTYNGLNLFHPEEEEFTRFMHDPADPGSLSHNGIRTIFEDGDGQLWVGATGGGLNRFDEANQRFIKYRHSDDPKSLSHNHVVSITQDSGGQMWIGTTGGLNRYIPEDESFRYSFNEPNRAHSLSNNTVFSVYEDRGGVIWIGTDEGISRFHRVYGRFRHLAFNETAKERTSATAVTESSNGDLWVGSKRGLVRIGGEPVRTQRYRHNPSSPNSLSNDWITILHEGQDGTLWIGSNKGGLNQYRRETDDFVHYRHDPDDLNSLGSDIILSIFEDAEGRLWVGADHGGLALLNRETGSFTHFSLNDGDPVEGERQVGYMQETRDGLFYLSTFAGLALFDRDSGAVEFLRNEPENERSLSHNVVWSTHEDQRGWLWVATSGGLNRYSRGSNNFTVYRERDGLANDACYGILEDGKGHLWVSTAQGLSRFNPETHAFVNYGVEDGLQSNSFNARAFFKSRKGVMFFGGPNGVNLFQPDHINGNRNPPPVEITRFKRFDEVIPLIGADEIELSYRDNYFTFEYVALDYVNPSRNRYQYQLVGVDRDWVSSGSRRFASYTNLSPGHYTFKVKGSNNDGVWNETGDFLKIHIVPPFWRTKWFAVVIILDFIIFLVWVFVFQRRRMERQKFEALRALDLERKTEELEFARKVQLSMLPEKDIDLPEVEIVGRMRTATEVGGDYFDYIALDENRYCIVCGDATGHGMSAGLIVGMTKAALTNLVKTTEPQPTRSLLTDLNLTLYEAITQRSIGMGLSINLLDLKEMSLELSSAGMPFPLYYNKAEDQLEPIEMKCPPLGFMRNLPIQHRSFNLKPGDALIFLSDGFAERRNKEGSLWGVKALERAVRRICRAESSAQAMAERFMSASDHFADYLENEDDMTIVVIRVK